MDSAYYGMIMPWPVKFVPKNWALCDGRLMQIAENQALYALIGTMYGGNGRDNFALPDLRGRTIKGTGTGPGLYSSTLANYTGVESVSADAILPEHIHYMPTSGMSADLSTAQIKISADEMDIKLDGAYGLPITSSSDDATGMPSDSDHYLGTPKMPNGSPLNTYNTSASEPTVTTKPTTISVSGKATPTISATMSDSASVAVASNLSVSQTGHKNLEIPIMQASITLNYIICIDGVFPSRW